MMTFFDIKLFFVCICFLSFGADLNAQTKENVSYTVSGKVIDHSDHAPIEFANVVLSNATDNSLAGYADTDSEGIFILKCKEVGDYYLSVSYLGYKPYKTATFQLSPDNKTVVIDDILLEYSSEELSEVVVFGQKRKVVYKLDKQVIEAAGYLSAAGGTAVDILAQTPSIRMDAEGDITFRGSSGFKVYIDGKPAALGGTAALEQIPVGQIENIEVLTTPSARNDADGSAGIININTKTQNLEGWSGIINVMGSSELSRNIDFLYALRKKDYRWQLSGEVSRRYVLSDFEQSKTIFTADTTTVSRSTGNRERHTDNYYLRSGLDWDKGNTTWSTALQVGYRDRWRGGDLHYEDSYESLVTGAKTHASFNGSDFVNLHEWNLRPEFGLEHRFPDREGHKLTATLYGLYEGDAMEHFQTDLWDMTGKQAQGHRAYEQEYRFTSQGNVDYIYPFANTVGKFESGYQFYTYTEDGDYSVDWFDDVSAQFVRRDDLYNKYLFRRDIHALYALLSDKYANFSYQVGLRGEYAHRKLGNNLAWADHTTNKFDLFPSVHLALDLENTQVNASQVRLSYSRRITQPELFYMEPYVVYVDFYTAQRGNPYIKPEYTNSVELGYNKSFGNNTFSSSLFHRTRKDKIERIRIPYQNAVTLDSMTNVGNDYATGLELATDIRFNPWWNLDANGSLYYYEVKNEFKINGTDENSWNWQLAVNNNLDVAKNTRMRLEAYYVGPMVSTQGRVNEFFYLNLAIRQQLMNRKLVASLVVRDILSTAKYTRTQSVLGMDSRTVIHPSAPLLTLTLSYSFNNFNLQQKKESVTHDIFEGTNR